MNRYANFRRKRRLPKITTLCLHRVESFNVRRPRSIVRFPGAKLALNFEGPWRAGASKDFTCAGVQHLPDVTLLRQNVALARKRDSTRGCARKDNAVGRRETRGEGGTSIGESFLYRVGGSFEKRGECRGLRSRWAGTRAVTNGNGHPWRSYTVVFYWPRKGKRGTASAMCRTEGMFQGVLATESSEHRTPRHHRTDVCTRLERRWKDGQSIGTRLSRKIPSIVKLSIPKTYF